MSPAYRHTMVLGGAGEYSLMKYRIAVTSKWVLILHARRKPSQPGPFPNGASF
jgi:hypothetical protein